MRIEACQDSHVHWLATGEFSQRLDLSGLKRPEDLLSLKTETHHIRGGWLFGYGWDQTQWPEGKFPTREILDQWQPQVPVVLSRCDGHTYWVNTEALKRAKIFSQEKIAVDGGVILRDSKNWPTGILVDQAKEFVNRILPSASAFDLRRQLLKGVQIFNEAGFTHIRDMTCTPEQWEEAVKLDETGLLTLAVEEFFWVEEFAELQRTVDFVREAKHQGCKNLRAMGLKVFLDGSLGSESADLSCAYHDHKGLRLWRDEDLLETLRVAWQNNLEVAVHAIGDQASERAAQAALTLQQQGMQGRLHLEHAQVLQQDTLLMLKKLNVICHLQPCHFLTDQKWLQKKLGDLYPLSFPWRRLQENGVLFDFGSDAPLEAPSYFNTLEGLKLSAEQGIPRLLGDPHSYMSHSDLAWVPNCYTEFNENRPIQVVFRGEHLI